MSVLSFTATQLWLCREQRGKEGSWWGVSRLKLWISSLYPCHQTHVTCLNAKDHQLFLTYDSVLSLFMETMPTEKERKIVLSSIQSTHWRCPIGDWPHLLHGCAKASGNSPRSVIRDGFWQQLPWGCFRSHSKPRKHLKDTRKPSLCSNAANTCVVSDWGKPLHWWKSPTVTTCGLRVSTPSLRLFNPPLRVSSPPLNVSSPSLSVSNSSWSWKKMLQDTSSFCLATASIRPLPWMQNCRGLSSFTVRHQRNGNRTSQFTSKAWLYIGDQQTLGSPQTSLCASLPLYKACRSHPVPETSTATFRPFDACRNQAPNLVWWRATQGRFEGPERNEVLG